MKVARKGGTDGFIQRSTQSKGTNSLSMTMVAGAHITPKKIIARKDLYGLTLQKQYQDAMGKDTK